MSDVALSSLSFLCGFFLFPSSSLAGTRLNSRGIRAGPRLIPSEDVSCLTSNKASYIRIALLLVMVVLNDWFNPDTLHAFEFSYLLCLFETVWLFRLCVLILLDM